MWQSIFAEKDSSEEIFVRQILSRVKSYIIWGLDIRDK